MDCAYPVVAPPRGISTAAAQRPELPAFAARDLPAGAFAGMLAEQLRLERREIRPAPPTAEPPAPHRSTGAAHPGTGHAAPEPGERSHTVAQDFEALIIYQLLKQMWNAIPQGGLFGKSLADQFFREMWLDELSKQVSADGGVGLAPVIESELAQHAPLRTPAPRPS